MRPPEDGVVMYLNRKGFNQSAIRPAAKAYLQTLLYLEESGATESHGDTESSPPVTGSADIELEPITLNATATVAPASAPLSPPPPSNALLNQISMNIVGDKVHLNGLLDLKGVLDLEKKLAALKVLLQVYEVANDTGDPDESGG